MNQGSSASRWGLARPITGVQGYIYGCRYPSLVAAVQGAPLSGQARDQLWSALVAQCPLLPLSPPQRNKTPDWRQSVDWLLAAWQALQSSLGLPVYETGRILGIYADQVHIVVPVTADARSAMVKLIQTTLEFLDRAETDRQPADPRPLAEAINALGRFAAKGSNTPRFIQAAFAQGIPFQAMPEGVYQFGMARNARWMYSSITDTTPTIAAKLAKSKAAAADVLRRAGIPVPPHRLVRSTDEALRAADLLGYPVVVKPADLDGGIGVAAGLTSREEVLAAFESALQHSRHILVEKHVEGRDYRLVVLNGDMIWAIERRPGGVVGDGQHTVHELVDQLNADPRRGTDLHTPLKRLVLDEEAQVLLARQGLDGHSVPAPGQFVRFRRAANIAGGGTPVAVFDRVHPDNARLAVRAAEALRVDLAGIDLLIPDIATSWRESGAAICEVNAQPNLGHTTSAHLYPEILRRRVPDSGRVPTIVVVSADQPERWLAALSGALAQRGLRVGTTGPHGVAVAGEVLHADPLPLADAGQMLVMNREVDAMVMALCEPGALRTGLPVARYDALIIDGTDLPSAQGAPGARGLQESLTHLLPACDGIVMARGGDAFGLRARKGLTAAAWHPLGTELAKAAEQIVERVHQLSLKRGRQAGPG